MKLEDMNAEQREDHHRVIAEALSDIVTKAASACNSPQDYVDFMGFALDSVTAPFMGGLKEVESEAKKARISTSVNIYEITELEKKEEAEDGEQ